MFAQKNKVCLDSVTAKYLILQDISQKSLCIDTSEYKSQIREKNGRISNLKIIEYDLKEAVRVQKNLADNYKSSAIAFQDKYTKTQDKAKFRGKVLIGSLVLNVALIAIGIILLKIH